MRNEFVESLHVKTSLKKNKNIYSLQKKITPHMKVLISSEEISKRIQEMAEQIAIDYREKELALVCVEFGGREFYNLLIDNLHSLGIKKFYQGAVKMERGATKTTEDRIEPKFHFESGIVADKRNLVNKHLLLVNDQISSGKTFDFLRNRYANALSVELATLIVKSAASQRLDDIKYHSFFIKSRDR